MTTREHTARRKSRSGVRRLGVLALFATACGDPALERAETTREAVTNGSPASIDAVIALVDSDGRLVCSGTLVAARVVITAAHCVASTEPSEVRFGTDPFHPRRAIEVADRRRHPDFDATTLENDVAVLWLEDPADDVAPAALPAVAALPSPGAAVRIAGFGRTDAPADHLQRAGTARVSQTSGGDLWLSAAPSQPCTGDSGGPVFRDAIGTEIVAVTSHGDVGCRDHAAAAPVYPAIDALVSPFLNRRSDEGGCAASGTSRPSPFACLAAMALLAILLGFRKDT